MKEKITEPVIMSESEYRRLGARPRRLTAAAVLAAAVIISVPLGTRTSLMRSYNKAQEAFVSGSGDDEYAYGICDDLGRISLACTRMLTVSEQYPGATDSGLADELRTAASELDSAIAEQSPGRCKAAMDRAASAADALRLSLNASGKMTQTHERLVSGYYADINSAQLTIEKNDDNKLADEYISDRKSFPASLIAPLVGAPEREHFE